MSTDRIAALAAELSESDIGEIIRAKVPAKIKGRDVSTVSVTWSNYGEPIGVASHVSVHAGARCAVCVPTFAHAVEIVSAQLGNPTDEARDLRAKAAELIEEAAKIENQEGAKS
jgi:hypothetical protein